MKILIAQSYFRVLDPKELERQMPYPALGALYAASILKNLKHEVIFFDSMLSRNPADLNVRIKETKPDLVLIYDDEFNYLTKMCLSNMRDAAAGFIRTAKELKIPSLIYSSDATDFSLPYLEAGCEAIIYGEGEATLQESIKAFENQNFDKVKKEISGLKFLDGNRIYATPRRKLMENIDDLPNPDYSLVDMNEYRNIWLNNHGYFSTNISTTRGCPFRCNWCAKPLYGQTYNSRSPLKVAAEIKELKANYKVDHLWITDDIFGLKPNWIKEFSDELNKINVKVPYKCLSRPDLLLRGGTIDDLKESGCRTIWIGAESGSQKILDAMDKGTTVEQIYQASSKIHEAGMEIAFFIQFGYSGENWKDIKLTRKMIRDCVPEDIGISVSYPLPGTVFFERVKEQMKIKTNWTDSDDLDMMFSGTYEKAFYKILHRFVHSEYRIIKYLKHKRLGKLPKILLHAFRFIKFRLKLNKYLTEYPAGMLAFEEIKGKEILRSYK
ncbi:MAG TPA: radical SAM protein [Ignavibacteriaceae bacterium]|nr:radical SAM protein [Ignavibacteriaceae bacterium]